MTFDLYGQLIGAALLVAAAFSFYRAVQGYRTEKAHWHVGPEQDLAADREDDPVGHSTAMWGNAVVGIFALYLGGWMLLR